MRVARDPSLAVAWLPTKLTPPQLDGVFFCKAAFSLASGAPIPDAPLPSGDVTGDDGLLYPSDFVPFKPRADVLVRATAHAPGDRPVRYLKVGIRVGALHKQLVVAGERRWQRGLLGRSAGEPEPFTTMPVTWSRALGGPKDRANPTGRGREGDLLPNIETPGRLLQSPSDRIPPAGFGPIPAAWPPRCDLVGTYGADYVKTRWPWYPKDFDFGHFNAAPPDQQIAGYLRGDEEFAFEHLHASRETVAGRLPGVRSRVFVTFTDGEFREVPQTLDTLFCDLHEDRLVLVWRGHTTIVTPLMHEVVHVLAMLEPLAAPRDAAHYRARRDHVPAREVAPAPDAVAAAEAAAADAAVEAKFAKLDADMAQIEAQAAAADAAHDQALLEQGIAPPPPPAAGGAVGAAATPGPAKTPVQMADAEAEAEASTELAALEAEFAAEKESMREQPAWTRESLLAAVAAGADLTGEDLSGVDLSGCALAGARLDGITLTKCTLTGSDLRGASCRGSVFAGADLTNTDFTGAALDGADLTGATLTGVRLAGASLARAVLDGQSLAGSDLSGCRGEGVHFAGADLRRCNLRGAAFPKGDFARSLLADADCSDADLQNVRLHAVDARGAKFQRARLTGARGEDGCNLTSADLRHADLDGAVIEFGIFRGADLRYATARRSLLNGCDFGQCDLSRADLERASLADANLTGARLLQTNLRYASLDRCELKGADARGANCYGAGFWDARTELCDLRDANVASTLLALR